MRVGTECRVLEVDERRTMRMLIALLPADGSAYTMLSTARSPAILRATTAAMQVQSWYDQGSRLTVAESVAAAVGVVRPTAGGSIESWYDSGTRINLPGGMSAAAAAASPQLLEDATGYQADVDRIQARLNSFPAGATGTMVGILRGQLRDAEIMLSKTVEAAMVAAPEPGMKRREAYYCNDEGCWIAQQYFCDETGCWIVDDSEAAPPLNKVVEAPVTPKKGMLDKGKKVETFTTVISQKGIFAPAVNVAVQAMGRKELNAFRASVIAEHTKVISKFVDTSESKFGQIALKRLFEAADEDGNGTLDKQEVKEALNALGFTFIQEKDVDKIFKKADKDNNEVIDFEEFVQEAPKTLRTSLVKLAKSNGHDLGFLA